MKKNQVLFVLFAIFLGLSACKKPQNPNLPQTDLKVYAQKTDEFHKKALEFENATFKTQRPRSPTAFKQIDLDIRNLALKTSDCDELLDQVLNFHTYWIYEYEWLLTHIQKLGYQFGDIKDLKDGAFEKSKKVYLRYDIHVRDATPLFGIFAVNRKNSIPSAAYIQWGFTNLEEKNRPLFSSLKQCSYPGLEFGLHVEAISGVLEKDIDLKKWNGLDKWVEAGEAKKLFDKILKEKTPQKKIDEYTKLSLQKHQEYQASFEKEFKSNLTETVHGSSLTREINQLCAADKKYCIFEQLLANNITRIYPYGKESDKHMLIDDVKIIQLTDTNPVQDLLCKMDRVAKENLPFILLLHPAQFFRQARIYSGTMKPGQAIDVSQCAQTNFDDLDERVSRLRKQI